MLLGSSISHLNSIVPHLFSIPYTGSQLKKGLILNSLHFALNFWMVLPLPTSQTFFTFTLLLGSSVLLQTPECSEYQPFAQNKVVSALSLTKLQQHGTSFPLLSVTHPLSVPSNLPWKPFSFRKLFLQSPALRWLCVTRCVFVYRCVYSSAHACVCCLCIWTFDVQIYVCVRFVSA